MSFMYWVYAAAEYRVEPGMRRRCSEPMEARLCLDWECAKIAVARLMRY
jgi:hypothetical protein